MSPDERAVLRRLVAELRELLLADEDPALARLYPPGYGDDEDRSREWHRLVHDELLARRLEALDLVDRTLESAEADTEALECLMRSVNDLRLVIGTRLGVREDEGPELVPGSPDEDLVRLYHALGILLEEIVDGLASSFGRP